MVEYSNNEKLPLTLNNNYRGYVDYLFLKQDISKMSLDEGNAFVGLKLTFYFFWKLPSIRRGYRDYRWLERSMAEHEEKGDSVVVRESGGSFTVKIRS